MENPASKYIHLIKDHNLVAPGEIVPYLVSVFRPGSVVDVGCGLGTFLHVFLTEGVGHVLGIDGNWVDKSKLFIPVNNYLEKDLEHQIILNQKYDLVLCLEVAEHLAESSANILVDNLVALGDIIVFSAAIENQGGQNHINEQPFTYWRDKFHDRGFQIYDVFRNRFWNNPRVDWWYKQNMFLVAKDAVNIENYLPGSKPVTEMFEYVHPDLLAMHVNQAKAFKEDIKKIKQGGHSTFFYWKLFKQSLRKHFFLRS